MATSDPATRRDLSQRLVEWLRAMVYDQSLVNEELIESRFKQATDPTTLATIRAIYSKQAIGAMTDFRRENPTPTLSHLSSIEAPALITWGRDDRVNPNNDVAEIARSKGAPAGAAWRLHSSSVPSSARSPRLGPPASMLPSRVSRLDEHRRETS